jgi:hypothetical protein
VREHLPAAAGEVLAVVQGRAQSVAVEQLLQQLLALDLRDGAQVVAVKIEQVEGIIFDAALPTRRQRRLELREVGAPVLDDDRLAVDDGLARNAERLYDACEPLGPIQPVAGVRRRASAAGIRDSRRTLSR